MLPSKLLLFITNQPIIIDGFLIHFERWVMCEYPQDYYLVNWRNGKYIKVWKNCKISQKAINKNAIMIYFLSILIFLL